MYGFVYASQPKFYNFWTPGLKMGGGGEMACLGLN